MFGKKLRIFLPHCDFILTHLFAGHKFSFHSPSTGFSQKLSTFSTGFSTGQAVEKPVISCIFWETVKKSPQHTSQLWRFLVDRTPNYPLFHIFGLSKTQPSFLFSTGEQWPAEPAKSSRQSPNGALPTNFTHTAFLRRTPGGPRRFLCGEHPPGQCPPP